VQQIDQKFNDDITQTIRIFKGLSDPFNSFFIEIIHDVQTPVNRDLITRYYTDIQNNGTVFADNSFEMIERPYTSRFGATNITNMIAGNFVPMIRAAYIKDDKYQFTILTEQSMAVSSQNNGSIDPNNGNIETLLHRRLNLPDRRGMGEALNDTSRIKIKQWIIGALNPQSSETVRPKLSYKLQIPPIIFYGDAVTNLTAWNSYRSTFSALNGELPSNINLLTLSARDQNVTEVVLRLNHLYEIGQDITNSIPVNLNITKLFENYNITSFASKTLSLLQDSNTDGDTVDSVILNPANFKTAIMQIALKNIDIQPKQNQNWFTIDAFLIGIGATIGVALIVIILVKVYKSYAGKKGYQQINND